VYTRCLFCTGNLGRNEAVEAFPVGRRLAYDAAKGRLWVVCPRCARWNLTPLEERWEAIEQAERLFRGTRLRASTDNVGLARLADRTDLVRVGRPLRPELAAWRYGTTFLRRRRRALAKRVVTESLYAGLALATGNWWMMYQTADTLLKHATGEASVARADAVAGADVPVRIAGCTVIAPVRSPDVDVIAGDHGEMRVEIAFGRGRRMLDKEDSRRVLDALLFRLNGDGAPGEDVRGAVRCLVTAGSAADFLRLAAARTQRARAGSRPRPGHPAASSGLNALLPADRLALEMALHEERERRALDGELSELERAWHSAEEIAAIADDLTVPNRVQRALARLRGSAERGG
jgi:hypothetical protein